MESVSRGKKVTFEDEKKEAKEKGKKFVNQSKKLNKIKEKLAAVDTESQSIPELVAQINERLRVNEEIAKQLRTLEQDTFEKNKKLKADFKETSHQVRMLNSKNQKVEKRVSRTVDYLGSFIKQRSPGQINLETTLLDLKSTLADEKGEVEDRQKTCETLQRSVPPPVSPVSSNYDRKIELLEKEMTKLEKFLPKLRKDISRWNRDLHLEMRAKIEPTHSKPNLVIEQSAKDIMTLISKKDEAKRNFKLLKDEHERTVKTIEEINEKRIRGFSDLSTNYRWKISQAIQEKEIENFPSETMSSDRNVPEFLESLHRWTVDECAKEKQQIQKLISEVAVERDAINKMESSDEVVDAKLEKYEQKIAMARRINEKLQKKMKERDEEEAERLKKTKQMKQNIAALLLVKNSESRQRIAEEARKLQDMIEQLWTSIKQNDGVCSELRRQLVRKQRELNEMNGEFEDLTKRSDDERQSYEKRMIQQYNNFGQKNTKRAELLQKIVEFRDSLDGVDARQEMHQLKQAYQSQRLKCDTLSTELSNQKHTSQRLEEEMDRAKTETNDFRNLAGRHRNMNDLLESRLQRDRQTLTEMRIGLEHKLTKSEKEVAQMGLGTTGATETEADLPPFPSFFEVPTAPLAPKFPVSPPRQMSLPPENCNFREILILPP